MLAGLGITGGGGGGGRLITGVREAGCCGRVGPTVGKLIGGWFGVIEGG